MSAMTSSAILEEDEALLNVDKMTGDMALLMRATVQAAATVEAPLEMRTDARYSDLTAGNKPMTLAFDGDQHLEASVRLNEAAERLYYAFD